MAKHGIKSIKPVDFTKLRQKYKDYTTTTGLKIRLKAVPLKLIDKAQDSIQDPEAPKYEMEVFGGDVQEDVLTEEVVKSYEQSDSDGLGKEYRVIFDKYMDALRESGNARHSKVIKIIQMRGIEFAIPDEKEWLEEMEELEIKVPPAGIKRKLWYLDNEVMANPRDMAAIFDGVMSLSGLPKEALAEARDSFRDLLADEEGDEDPAEGSSE